MLRLRYEQDMTLMLTATGPSPHLCLPNELLYSSYIWSLKSIKKGLIFTQKIIPQIPEALCVLNKRAGCFSLQTVLHFPKDMDLTDTNSQKARAVDFVTFDKRGSFFLLRNRAN